MILADTSVWVDHLRKGDPTLKRLLEESSVLQHSFIIGELACGNLARRAEFLHMMSLLPLSLEASHDEAMTLLTRHKLWGLGIGWVDVHLLASALLSEARLYTRDGSLRHAAEKLKIGY